MPPRKQHVALLLAKAAQDEYVLDKLLDDPNAPLEVFGFHAQQTAEKLLKAVLSHAGIAYPRTHQLVELLDLAADHDIQLPAETEELRHLTPFAVEFRYDVLPGEEQSGLDKAAVRRELARLRTWIETRIHGKIAETPAKYTTKRKQRPAPSTLTVGFPQLANKQVHLKVIRKRRQGIASGKVKAVDGDRVLQQARERLRR